MYGLRVRTVLQWSDQTLVPDATEQAGSWTAVGAASIHAALASVDDTSYASLASGSMPSTTRVRLTDGLAPRAGDRFWRARLGRVGTSSVDITVTLRQGGGSTLGGGTAKGSITQTVTSGLATYNVLITDAITDYTDLYAEILASLT